MLLTVAPLQILQVNLNPVTALHRKEIWDFSSRKGIC